MERHGGRRVALGLVTLGCCITAVALFLGSESLLGWWHLAQLGEGDLDEQRTTIERLGELAFVTAAPQLLELIDEQEEEISSAALNALGKIAVRARGGQLEEIVDALCDLCPMDNPGAPIPEARVLLAGAVLREASRENPQVLRQLTGRLPRPGRFLHDLAVLAWFDAWPASREAIDAYLHDASNVERARFLHPPLDSYTELEGPVARALGQPANHRLRDGVLHFARRHADPEVRICAISTALVLKGSSSNLLRERFQVDKDPLVRRALLRIAGYLGRRLDGQGLDLQRLLLEGTSPALLAEVIDARRLWTRPLHLNDGVELVDKFVCTWLPDRSTARAPLLDWSPAEIHRLRSILQEEQDPVLRDAVSAALATRALERDTPRTPPVSLRVHEWGVWKDDAASLLPVKAIVEDLPAFVKRSRVDPSELWRHRAYEPTIMTVRKPVVFWYAEKPLSVYAQVHFYKGRPWAFYPEATDYLHTIVDVPGGGTGPTTARPPMQPPWAQPPDALPDFTPRPRLLVGMPPEPLERPLGEMRRRYRTVSWLVPGSPQMPRRSPFSTYEIDGMGLEWRGLRVGYPTKSEPARREAPKGHWWDALRQVDASPVALRGESEGFLFYDGAVSMASPLALVKADEGSVAFEVRSFEDLPQPGQWLGLPADEMRVGKTLPGALVIRKRDSEPAEGEFLRDLLPSSSHAITLSELRLRGDDVEKALFEALTSQGLSGAETRALLDTFRREFFAARGVRLISILPQWMYDAVLPLRVAPRPAEVVRVGLVVTECE